MTRSVGNTKENMFQGLIDGSPVWIITVIVVIILIVFMVALLKLRRRQMNDAVRLLWVLFLILLPLVGSLIFFIVHPGQLSDERRETI